jgi:hypothetical protein
MELQELVREDDVIVKCLKTIKALTELKEILGNDDIRKC